MFMSDGSTNVLNKLIVDFLVATVDVCIFLNAFDTSGEIKDGSFIAIICASNFVAARMMLLYQQYPNKLPWIDSVITNSKNVNKFITNHQYSQVCFRNHSHLDLLKSGETRLAAHFSMLQ
ncbi:hypothetical protein ACJMK2_040587 [Sinanodonta woodiana]|uniref:Uncharacterized protein n=1 Tax=Sinanodonta woodiana TaxID=1069815 RepID=A0ABD3W1G9_SINWO